MSLHSLILFIHVMAGVFLLGASLFSLYTRAALRAAQGTLALRTWIGFLERSTKLNPVAAMVLMASGIYLGREGYWTAGWFQIAVALWLMDAVYAAQVIRRAATRIGKAPGMEVDGPIPAQADSLRQQRHWEIAADVLLASDLAALYLMLDKPDLLPSVLIAVVVIALTVAAGLWWRARTAQPVASLQAARPG